MWNEKVKIRIWIWIEIGRKGSRSFRQIPRAVQIQIKILKKDLDPGFSDPLVRSFNSLFILHMFWSKSILTVVQILRLFIMHTKFQRSCCAKGAGTYLCLATTWRSFVNFEVWRLQWLILCPAGVCRLSDGPKSRFLYSWVQIAI